MTNSQLSPYPWLATLAFLLLLIGFFLPRRQRRLHAGLMSTGMVIDLTLVLVLEFSKDAVATALGHELGPWQYAHVISSTLAVFLYFPVFALGWIRLTRPSSNPRLAFWHLRLGYCAFAFRALGFLFMFSMLGR